MTNGFLLLFAFFLVALNGFFVAAEFSLVKMRPTRIRAIAKTQGFRGKMLATVHAKLDAYLSACQLGITLASLGLGWIGEPAFASLLEPLLLALGVSSPEIIHGISFAFAFFTISFLHIVLGELAPKSVAIRNPEIIGLWAAAPLYGFYWAMYPAIWLLDGSSRLVLRLFGLSAEHGHDTQYSSDELKLILREHRTGERSTREERNVLAQVLDFNRLAVSELMRPINEVVALHASASVAENMQVVYSHRFSRYPYFDSKGGEVLGMIHLKDLFLAQQQGKTIADLKAFLRPIQYVSGRTPALELFRRFRGGAPHFAVVGQKGQKLQGFITFDNLLGAMVGEIRDEFRQNENDWSQREDGSLIGKGSLSIFSLERALGIDIENEELEIADVESVSGLIMVQLGDVPTEGQKIEFEHFDIVVKKMSGPRILLVRVYPKSVSAEDEGAVRD
ncbi:MAG TPA: hemolysin family protein [Burkholderiaceae bacterium]